MQTKRDITRILAEADLLPVKGPGQHFMIDGNTLRKTAAMAELTPNDLVLEVGTGTGVLTELLAQQAGHVVTVDLDERLQAAAAAELADFDNITFIRTDVLETKHRLSAAVTGAIESRLEHSGEQLKIVSNLPYNIATPFILNTLESPLPVTLMVVMVQREAAERLAAASGTAAYGGASVIAQTLSEVAIAHRVPPTAFWPKPRVSSAILRIQPRRAKNSEPVDISALRSLTEILFQQRRKRVLSTVRKRLGARAHECFERIFAERAIRSDARPEELRVIDFQRLSNYNQT